MCGLVGLMTKNSNGFTKEQQEVFSTLLFVDFLRGPDSTGAFVVTNKGEVMLAKEASNAIDFTRSKAYDGLLQKAWSQGAAMIGHNRKATRGVVNDENAHPFVVDDNIVLVHNGTLWGDHKKIADVEVDSHAIAHAIHEKGDVTKALSSIDGAYALIWYDFAKEQICLIRNSQRPLWWAETSDSWIWSSEKSMLEFVISRHNLKAVEGPNELPEEELQTFTLKGQRWEVDSEKLKIEKPVYKSTFTGTQLTRGSQNGVPGYWENGVFHAYGVRRNPYQKVDDQVWSDMGGDVDPFVQGPRRGTTQQQQNTSSGGSSSLQTVTNNHTTSDTPGSTPFWEREMMAKQNKMITNDQWFKEVVLNYQFQRKVVAEAFDYCYANQKDTKGGYYLYSFVCDDPDIVVRMHFAEKHMTEERIMQIAGTGYIYEFILGTKQWKGFAPGAANPLTPGFVIIHAERATCLWGGGVGDSKYGKHAAGKVLQ